MEEKKKSLGTITDTKTGEKLEMVSAYVGSYTGDRRLLIAKTSINSIAIKIHTPDDNGDIREQQMHISLYDFSALLNGALQFVDEEGHELVDFLGLAVDDDSAGLYKNVNMEEEL